MEKNKVMNINPLSSNLVNLLADDRLTFGKSEDFKEAAGSFGDILSESLKTAEKTDTVDKLSSLQLLTGQSDDLSGLLLDAQKAELSLSLALQIRNKVIDAYNEMMRMQV